MKYLIEYNPIGASSNILVGSAESELEIDALITEHMTRCKVPPKFKNRYIISELVVDWHEVQRDSHWAAMEATVITNGVKKTICIGPYRKEAICTNKQ